MPEPKPQIDPETEDGGESLVVGHPIVRLVDPDIFRFTFAGDCMQHRCLCRDQGDRARADACCQHGADVLPQEKLAILRRASEIASVLKPDWRSPERWFDERDPEPLVDDPSVMVIRTGTTDLDVDDSGCVFLENVGTRGCGLHLAALRYDFDPGEIKPSVCRLYPLDLEVGRLGLSSDFDRYSCANNGTRSVYSAMRNVLTEMFGEELVRALDEVGGVEPSNGTSPDGRPAGEGLVPISRVPRGRRRR